MPEYTFGEFIRRQRFVDAVAAADIEVDNLYSEGESLDRKRGLLGVLYKNLVCEGGKRVPVAECEPMRVCGALKSEFARSQRFVADFQHMRAVIMHTGALLSLEERARTNYAVMPLFAGVEVAQAQCNVRDYLATLPLPDRKKLKAHFGGRVKQYLK